MTMARSKFYIKKGDGRKVPITSCAIYTTCQICGDEVELSFGNLYDDDISDINFDYVCICDKCTKQQAGRCKK